MLGQKFFFTRISIDSISGLLPIMTDMFGTNQSLDNQLYGPKNLVNMFQSMKFKFYRKLLPYSIYDLQSKQYMTGINNNEKLQQFVDRDDFTENFYFGNLEQFINKSIPQKNKNQANQYIKTDQESQQIFYEDKNTKIFPILLNGGHLVNYVIVPHKIKGSINKEKLKEYKIPNNMMGKLMKEGKIVIDDKEILLENLKDADKPSPVIIILELETLQQMDELIENQIFAEIYENQEWEVEVIIHQVSVEIAQNQKYQNFLKTNFDDMYQTQHIFVGLERNVTQKEEEQKNDSWNESLSDHFELTNFLNKQFPEAFYGISHEKQINNQGQIDLKNQKSNKYQLYKDLPELLNYGNQQKNEKHEQFASNRCQLSQKNWEFTVVPKKNFGYKKINDIEKKSSSLNYEEFFKQMEASKQEIQSQQQETDKKQYFDLNADPEITVLGTACMKPTYLRNVSGYLVQHENINILLDAGDGTYYQMLNHFGEKVLYDSILEKLQIIFISHNHSNISRNYNLYICLIGISALNKWFDETLNINVIFSQQVEKDNTISSLSLEQIEQRLQEIQKNKQKVQNSDSLDIHEELQKQKQLINYKQPKNIKEDKQQVNENEEQKQNVQDKKQQQPSTLQQEQEQQQEDEDDLDFVSPFQKMLQLTIINNDFGNQEENLLKFMKFIKSTQIIENIQAVPVIHCQQAYGIVIQYNNNYINKISFSGDTMPCPAFVEKASNSTLMIHEATFSDDFEEAGCRNHSTLGQAVTVGYTSLTEKLLLTHFSQRYKAIDILQFQHKYDDQFVEFLTNNTALAFDHLHFRLSDFHKLPAITRVSMNLLSNE
ncbi:hypothetical protein PPERSA_03433 [Pseudocohnilembus persalinus]|uniref:ribonuclease Z n=1 Tax=Pseudocohnilembus persalinus TaxID=266149 RepID=A0A0V0QBQ7_PSEPJ|nr:hypothetical protein PPERSA_03433 [Pseudocohnilembus persalinus]|eukprot:KRW99632.1 hypothetical protein PPERSA_03433 [Pseudocohnilembus persalinus]